MRLLYLSSGVVLLLVGCCTELCVCECVDVCVWGRSCDGGGDCVLSLFVCFVDFVLDIIMVVCL